jgi:DNA polymerase elongation subunit (family B)
MILSIETDGFSPESKLLVIGLRMPSKVRLWKRWDYPDEKSMVSAFVGHFLGMEGDKIIIGFNLLKFDVPVLLHKAAGLPRFEEFFRRLNSSNVIDLFTILTFLNEGQLKGLDHYCHAFGVRNLGPKRDEVARLYRAGTPGDKEKISNLVSLKLNTISELFLKSWGEVKDGQHRLWKQGSTEASP